MILTSLSTVGMIGALIVVAFLIFCGWALWRFFRAIATSSGMLGPDDEEATNPPLALPLKNYSGIRRGAM